MIKIQNEPYPIDLQLFTSKLEQIEKALKVSGTITIKLGDEKESHELNNLYRQKDYPTDVLSFPLNEPLSEEFYIGDIHICYPIACKQAEENRIKHEEELLILMIHGILHLCGHDHEADNGEMIKLQEQLAAKYGKL